MSQTNKLYLKRVRLNSGGYDSYGSYFGCGVPLYQFEGVKANGEGVHGHLRAMTRGLAKAKIREQHGQDLKFFN